MDQQNKNEAPAGKDANEGDSHPVLMEMWIVYISGKAVWPFLLKIYKLGDPVVPLLGLQITKIKMQLHTQKSYVYWVFIVASFSMPPPPAKPTKT